MALVVPVIERLRTQGTQLGKRVYGAAELAVVLDEAREIAAPEAFVALTGEDPDIATRDQEFSVAIAVNAQIDELGDYAQQLHEQIGGEVVAALEGWSPSSDHRPVVYSSAVLNRFTRSMLVWELIFTATLEREKLVTYEFSVGPILEVGAVVATVLGNIDTFVAAALPGATRLASDYVEGLEAGLAAGSTGYQIQALSGQQLVRGSFTRDVLRLVVRVHRRLGASDTERDYTEGDMQTQVQAVLDPTEATGWQGIVGVHSLDQVPELEFPSGITRQ